MAWIRSNRKTVIVTAVVVVLVSVVASFYLEWRLAPKASIRVGHDGERVATFVYRREADSLEPCQRDLRRLIDRFDGRDFSFEIEFVCSGGKLMVAYVQAYRVSYSAGTVTLTDLSMGGSEVEFDSFIVTSPEVLRDVLPDRLAALFGEFRDTTRARLHNVETATP